jgi:hypothetical protein
MAGAPVGTLDHEAAQDSKAEKAPVELLSQDCISRLFYRRVMSIERIIEVSTKISSG